MKKMLDVVFILDKSGSMSGSEDSTISSFNEYLEKERKNNYKTRITTILFSDDYSYLYKGADVSKVSPLTLEDYFASGCTALYDAIGSSINYIDRCDTDKVLFIIITDGYENASKEFDKEKIRRMIRNHSNYEFVYIGADIDSYSSGGSIGIKSDNIANFKKDRKGTGLLFKSVGNFESSMMEDSVSSSWKKDLDEYIEENSK
ncbi:MAG: VWA domain-containing protein [Bacilli bacterium]|nr:VWA domain-containing protein [Bacilli bacterium]